MRILILGFSKFKYMPYLFMHLDKYSNPNNKIDIVKWNRDAEKDIELEYNINNIYSFNYELKETKPHKKILGFYSYRKFVKSILKNQNYDLVIALHTFPAVLLNDVLIKQYEGKYIFDYRDVTYENNNWFKKLIAKIINSSKYTLVSSEGFYKYIPNNDRTFISHNISLSKLKDYKNLGREKSQPIIITFVGINRSLKAYSKVIQEFANDSRFIINFHGTKNNITNQLEKLANDYKAENINFYAEYNNIEKNDILMNSNMIFNIFDEDDYNSEIAMTNKFYDGIYYQLPQICNKGSLMSKIIDKENLGISIDYNDSSINDKIYDYYQNIDFITFEKHCNSYVNKVKNELEQIMNL